MPKQIFQRPNQPSRPNYGKSAKPGSDIPWGPTPTKGQRLGKGGKPMPAKTPAPEKPDGETPKD